MNSYPLTLKDFSQLKWKHNITRVRRGLSPDSIDLLISNSDLSQILDRLMKCDIFETFEDTDTVNYFFDNYLPEVSSRIIKEIIEKDDISNQVIMYIRQIVQVIVKFFESIYECPSFVQTIDLLFIPKFQNTQRIKQKCQILFASQSQLNFQKIYFLFTERIFKAKNIKFCSQKLSMFQELCNEYWSQSASQKIIDVVQYFLFEYEHQLGDRQYLISLYSKQFKQLLLSTYNENKWQSIINQIVQYLHSPKTFISISLLNKLKSTNSRNQLSNHKILEYFLEIKLNSRVLQLMRNNPLESQEHQIQFQSLFTVFDYLLKANQFKYQRIGIILQLFQMVIDRQSETLMRIFYRMFVKILKLNIISKQEAVKLTTIIHKLALHQKAQNLSQKELSFLLLLLEINNSYFIDLTEETRKQLDDNIFKIIYNVKNVQILKRSIQLYQTKRISTKQTIQYYSQILQKTTKDLFYFYSLKQFNKIDRVLMVISIVTKSLVEYNLIRVMSFSMYRKAQTLDLLFSQNPHRRNKNRVEKICIKSNSTVFDLKCLLAQIERITWKDIILFYKQHNGNNLSQIIADCNFQNQINKEIEKINDYIIDIVKPKYRLIQENRLSRQATQAFIITFNRYARNGKMSMEQCASFVKAAINQTEYSQIKHAVEILFTNYNENREHFLTVDDILSFFESCSLKQSQEKFVWRNLQNFGFRRDFKEKDCPDCQVPVFQKFPLHPLGSNEQLYGLLLDLIENKQTPFLAWNLLETLPIHKSVYDHLLQSDLTQILTLQSPHRLFYYLHVISDLLHNNQSGQIQLKCKQKMLEQKVFFKLLSLIKDLLSQQCSSQSQIKQKILILELILEIVEDQVLLPFKTQNAQKFENILKNQDQIKFLIAQINKKTNQTPIAKQDTGNNVTNEQRIFAEACQPIFLESITELLKQSKQSQSCHEKVFTDLLRFSVTFVFYFQDCSKLVQALPEFIFYSKKHYFYKILEVICCLVNSRLFSATEIMVPAFVRYVEEHLHSKENKLDNSFLPVLKLIDTEKSIDLPAQFQQVLASAILKSSCQQVTKSCALILSKTKFETGFDYFEQVWKQYSNNPNAVWSPQTRQYILKFIRTIIRQNPSIASKIVCLLFEQFEKIHKKLSKNDQTIEEQTNRNSIYQMMLDSNLPKIAEACNPRHEFEMTARTACSSCEYQASEQTKHQVLDLTSILKGCLSIQECIQQYFKPLQVQCPKCHKMCLLTKTISQFPYQFLIRPKEWYYQKMQDFSQTNQTISLNYVNCNNQKQIKQQKMTNQKCLPQKCEMLATDQQFNRKYDLNSIMTRNPKQSNDQSQYFYEWSKDRKGKWNKDWVHFDGKSLKQLSKNSIDSDNQTAETINNTSKRIILLAYLGPRIFENSEKHDQISKNISQSQKQQILYLQQLVILFKETQQHNEIMKQHAVALLDHCLKILCLTKSSENKEKILKHINQIIQQNINSTFGQQIISKHQFRKLHEVENDNGKSLNEIFFTFFKPLASIKSLGNEDGNYPEYILQFLGFKSQLLKRRQDQICLYLGQNQAEFWAELLQNDVALTQHILGDRIIQIFMAFLFEANNNCNQNAKFNQTQQQVQRATIRLLQHLKNKTSSCQSISQTLLKHKQYLKNIYLNNFQLTRHIVKNYFHNNLQHSDYLINIYVTYYDNISLLNECLYEILQNYLMIQDDYQFNRFSFVFGEPILHVDFDQQTVPCCSSHEIDRQDMYHNYVSKYGNKQNTSFFQLLQKSHYRKSSLTFASFILDLIVYNDRVRGFFIQLPSAFRKAKNAYELLILKHAELFKNKYDLNRFQKEAEEIKVKNKIMKSMYEYFKFKCMDDQFQSQQEEVVTDTVFEICQEYSEQSQYNQGKQYQHLVQKEIISKKIKKIIDPPEIDQQTQNYFRQIQLSKSYDMCLMKFESQKQQVTLKLNEEIRVWNYRADIALLQSVKSDLGSENVESMKQEGRVIQHNLRGILVENLSANNYRIYYKQGIRYLGKHQKQFINTQEVQYIEKQEDVTA